MIFPIQFGIFIYAYVSNTVVFLIKLNTYTGLRIRSAIINANRTQSIFSSYHSYIRIALFVFNYYMGVLICGSFFFMLTPISKLVIS